MAALVLIALVWVALLGFLRADKAGFHGDEYSRPAFDFSLTDHPKPKVSLFPDHAGKVILLNFGFTNCPDICPTTLGMLGRVLDLVGTKGRWRFS